MHWGGELVRTYYTTREYKARTGCLIAMICLSGVTVFDKHVGLMDKARCKSKYDLNLIAEQAALTTTSDNSLSSSSSSNVLKMAQGHANIFWGCKKKSEF